MSDPPENADELTQNAINTLKTLNPEIERFILITITASDMGSVGEAFELNLITTGGPTEALASGSFMVNHAIMSLREFCDEIGLDQESVVKSLLDAAVNIPIITREEDNKDEPLNL